MGRGFIVCNGGGDEMDLIGLHSKMKGILYLFILRTTIVFEDGHVRTGIRTRACSWRIDSYTAHPL